MTLGQLGNKEDEVSGWNEEWVSNSADAEGLRAELEQLARRNSDLQRSNQDLQRLMFVVSHDLHEPLYTITKSANTLTDRWAGALDHESSLCLDDIALGAARMKELLSDLLVYTEVSTRPAANTESVDLNLIVDNVRRNLKVSIQESGAAINCDDLPVLRVHASDFISLFQNLLSNAIKYRTNNPPQIHILFTHEEAALRFAVADNGIGIDSAYHVQIFEPFRRLHGKNVPGTGLGLAICKRVIDWYGGRIWVESQLEHGSKFWFTLPESVMA